ncbi:MAG: DUF883 family protein [Methyloceanibacter sp.]|nr:DUF883 family protein [Methyloceanibacter sp.]
MAVNLRQAGNFQTRYRGYEIAIFRDGLSWNFSAQPDPACEKDEMTTPNEAFKRAANSPVGRQATGTAKSIGEDVTDFADDLSRKASKQFARAQDRAADAYDNAYAAVRRDPVIAIAIALGIGFLFGIVLATRR